MKRMARVVSRLLLRRAWPRTRGTGTGHGLDADVEITRDEWGIPHVTARTLHDLLYAQGYVHAQDRLWQMETLRRICEGRVSEVAGTATVGLDWFCRASGMADMKRRELAGLQDEERDCCHAYADGVNACVTTMGGRLPLEFSGAKIPFAPWSAEDCASSLPYVAFTQTFWPWAAKLLAISRANVLTETDWNEMFPVSPGAVLPHDEWFDRAPGLRFGSILPGALSFHGGLSRERPTGAMRAAPAAPQGAGSNNWAVARARDGSPMVANDPHMGAVLPSIWYLCHLCIPGVLNVAGTSLAGSPGVVIGRNDRVAWALTNFMLDAVDVLTYRVDPADPLVYRTNAGTQRMRAQSLSIGLPGGRSTAVPLLHTEKGPVVTSLEKGVNAAAVMHWYGTPGENDPRDRSLQAVLRFMKARTAAELLEAARMWRYVSMNFVAADADGHVGWQVSGAAPARRGYTGRLPGDASAGAGWGGFLDALPRASDPNFIVTANYKPDGYDERSALSFYWCAPYRHDRLSAAIGAMKAPGMEDFRTLQMDVHSAQADRIVPRILALGFDDPGAQEAAGILAAWDREVRAESAGAAVFEVFLVELIRVLLSDKLGPDLDMYFNALSYSVENEIFDRPQSSLWKGDMRGTVSAALARTIQVCEQRMGRRRRGWRWGRLHRYAYHHLGARTPLARWLLDPAAAPADGDNNTVNVSWSSPCAGSYGVTTIPSMRMVAALGDPDGLYMNAPIGQSGQPGHRHYDDLFPLWRQGKLLRIPLTPEGVRAVARDRLVLRRSRESAV